MRETDISYELVTHGRLVNVKRTSMVDPDDVDVTVHRGGVRIQPKSEPASLGCKYTLQAEDGACRIVALRDIAKYGIRKGARGGLVYDSATLSQDGECWIAEGAVATHARVRVLGGAYVDRGVQLTGRVIVQGCAFVSGSRTRISANNNSVYIDDFARLIDVVINTGGAVTVAGIAFLRDCIIEPPDDQSVALHLGSFEEEGTQINGFYQAMALSTRHGVLTARRDEGGGLQMKIGCQRFTDAEEFRRIADDHGASAQEREMIAGFVQMAQAAQQFWPGNPRAGELPS
jgi:hypothetical protein